MVPQGPGGKPGMAGAAARQISTEPSSATTCHLAPGKTYYINFVRSGVANDTILPPSPTCINPNLEFCGVQMRVE